MSGELTWTEFWVALTVGGFMIWIGVAAIRKGIREVNQHIEAKKDRLVDQSDNHAEEESG